MELQGLLLMLAYGSTSFHGMNELVIMADIQLPWNGVRSGILHLGTLSTLICLLMKPLDVQHRILHSLPSTHFEAVTFPRPIGIQSIPQFKT